jgi:NitT/TauT family transport system substrate-binding protein
MARSLPYLKYAKRLVITGLVILSSVLPSLQVKAEAAKVRVATQFGLGYLPLIIMGHDKLWEKQAKLRGVEVETEFSQLGGGATLNDALVSGAVQVVAGGFSGMLLLWDRTRKNFGVRALAAMNISPIFLLSNKDSIKSVKDLTENDRVAVPGIGRGSIQAIFFSMAVEKAFGNGNASRFDSLQVTMQLPDAYAALISGGTPITAAFLSSPFQERALNNPKIHKIADSFEIQGSSATVNVVYAKADFVRDNPKLVAAFYDALRESIAAIKEDPGSAIDKYAEATGDKTDKALLLSVLTGPQFSFNIAPKNTKQLADFLTRIGVLSAAPTSWKDYFFEPAQGLDGG